MTEHPPIDVTHLDAFIAVLADAQLAAEAIEDSEPPAGWGAQPGAIYERAAHLLDMLKRTLIDYPRNTHYTREKGGAVVSAAHELSSALMTAPYCDHEELEGVDADGVVHVRDCDRLPHHAGDHQPRAPFRRIARQADDVGRKAIALTSRVRWALLDTETIDADTADHIRDARTELATTLADLDTALTRLTD